jgi:hypothetical protein
MAFFIRKNFSEFKTKSKSVESYQYYVLIALNYYLTRVIVICFFKLCFLNQCFCQSDGLYQKAFEYIFKSKQLADFRNEIRMNEGVIIKRIIVSDSICKNNPYLFLCAILNKKTKSNGDCTKQIGKDRLKVYDSITQEYKNTLIRIQLYYLSKIVLQKKERHLHFHFQMCSKEQSPLKYTFEKLR